MTIDIDLHEKYPGTSLYPPPDSNAASLPCICSLFDPWNLAKDHVSRTFNTLVKSLSVGDKTKVLPSRIQIGVWCKIAYHYWASARLASCDPAGRRYHPLPE